MSEITEWIRLTETPGIGCDAAIRLLRAFGLPQQIFAADHADLKQVVSSKQANSLASPPTFDTVALIERTELWCEAQNNFFVTLADKNYPSLLLEIADPPTILYIKGRIELLSSASIAVVGSRNATNQGVNHARQFSSSLSRLGLTIVSGLASGIDAAAHQGALDAAGSTIAVIGTGIDLVYPAKNKALAHQIANSGCIVSEYPLGTSGIASNFPRRNRIISGLSLGVLVIEAAAQSGSLITARMASEQGREVFAIPGSIHSPLAKGCHQLIKQGAKLVETAQDILEELPLHRHNASPPAISEQGDLISAGVGEIAEKLLEEIGFEPIHPDELVLRCKMSSGQLTSELVMLELTGQIEVLAGGLYRRLN